MLYFASLSEGAGCATESIESQATDLAALYAQVARRHGFTCGTERLRVAVGDCIVDWNHVSNDGDEIVFLPLVLGG